MTIATGRQVLLLDAEFQLRWVGIAHIEGFGFETYYEGIFAIAACENYHATHGHYPAHRLVDQAYLSRDNRRYFKLRHIACVAKPLGRPPVDPAKRAAYDAALDKWQTPGERNPIEGWFGLGKRRYGLGRLRCRKAAPPLANCF